MHKIFMVEDNPDHALLIRRGIEGSACAIAHYEDGLRAVEACEAVDCAEARPDLVLLDLKLPGMDGFGVLERLRKMKWFKHVPIVMLTTSSRKEEIEQAYRFGASGYVVKSDDFGEFTAKLKRVKDYWLSTVELPRPNVSHD